jgi:hypothetical protein
MTNLPKILLQTPDPTPTIIAIYPPADPNWAKLMIGVAILSVVVVIIGMWLNR